MLYIEQLRVANRAQVRRLRPEMEELASTAKLHARQKQGGSIAIFIRSPRRKDRRNPLVDELGIFSFTIEENALDRVYMPGVANVTVSNVMRSDERATPTD